MPRRTNKDVSAWVLDAVVLAAGLAVPCLFIAALCGIEMSLFLSVPAGITSCLTISSLFKQLHDQHPE